MKKLIATSMGILFCTSLYAENAALALQAKLNAIRTMSASFSQVVKTKRRVVSKSSGTMALSRPGRFRWQTKEPMAQLVVADGKKLWIYDVELEQVTVKNQQKNVGGTAGLFLSGYDNTVARDFNVSSRQDGNREHFDLEAKKLQNGGFQKVEMEFKGPVLTTLVLYDQLGQVTEVLLKRVQNNPKLADNLFHFTPPRGVDVVKQ